MSGELLPRKARVADILAVASRLTGMSIATIAGKSHKREVMKVRQAVYVVARRADHSLPQIGVALDKNHSSVASGIRSAEERMARDSIYRGFVEQIERQSFSQRPFARVVEVRPEPKPEPERERPRGGAEEGQAYFERNVIAGSRRLAAALVEALAA